jgi:hypothetical protein
MTVRSAVAKRYKANSLDQVMIAIGKIVRDDAANPELIKLARRITAGDFDYMRDPRTGEEIPVIEAWKRPYRAPTGPVCRTRDDACELDAIWDFAVMNLRYTMDPPHVDTYADSRYILESHNADCDEFTILIASLAMAVGFEPGARVISQSGQSWEHIYPMIGVPKANAAAFFPMDATDPGAYPGWEYPNPRGKADFYL